MASTTSGCIPAWTPRPRAGRLHLERPYVLTVASRLPRKNLAALEPAARRLDELGVDLVAAGGRGRSSPARAPPVRSASSASSPRTCMPALYAGAAAFVLPSLHEGFGLPVLEAMAAGVPVVASDRAALPGTCGGAALLVDPTDPAAIAEAVEAAIGDERLVAAGLARAAEFSWARTAGEVDGVLRQVYIRA